MKTKRKAVFSWILRIFGGLIGLLIVLSIIGSIYQTRASQADRSRFRPSGELVEVNGRSMHIDCQGEGSPTVILDAGTGGWSIAWSELMPELAKSTRVCSYDRAGLGWSDAAKDDRSPQVIADDLKALLDAANVTAPYIITGFSYTGLSSRLFSAQYPNDVVGLVLIDPTTEVDNELMGEELMRQQSAAIGVYQVFGLAARLGLVRFLEPQEMAPYAPFILEDAIQPDIYYSFLTEPVWWQTSQKEFMARLKDETLADVAINGEIRDIPTIIIAAETINGDNEGFEALQEARFNHLRELASRSSLGEFVLAENSSHEVARDRPDIVIEAIQKVIEASRSN